MNLDTDEAGTVERALELSRILLQLNPLIAENRDSYGRTALHYSMGLREDAANILDIFFVPPFTALALLLIDAYPEGVSMKDVDEMTPFHAACRAKADFEVFKAMLEVNPTLASQLTLSSDMPFDVLCRANGSTIDERVTLILLTTLKGRVMDPVPTEHLLHAACNYRCPQSLYRKLFTAGNDILQQLTIRDDQGNLPLHYAVRASFLQSVRKKRWWLHSFQNDSTTLIGTLLDLFPEAASMADHEGRLPLFIALKNPGMSWVRRSILRIVDAYPQVLNRRDAENKLFPALLAATRANESTEHLSISYELLLKTPEMMLHAL